MNLPGGDALIYRAAEIMFDHLERIEQRHNPAYRPKAFSELAPQVQQVFLVAQRENLKMMANTLLADMAMAVEGYDGCMGAAYQRLIHRYAQLELGHKIVFPE